MAPAVSLHEVVVLAGRFPLLAGVSLEIDEGEVAHVRGPNGAGKTSLLRLCCGLVPLHSGAALVLGNDLALDRRSVRRSVGLFGHESHLYDELTVEENLVYSLRSWGVGTRDASSRAGRTAAQLDLKGRLATTTVGRLSAGQRRRTALAVLVARDPRLWLLDEPHAGLDQEGRELLDGVIAESREKGRTVLLSSHEHEHAAAISDRVIALAGGRVAGETVGVA
ncbi:MAG: heme ABC exporter ATP-binding protein CcmA [Acidimicrobiales bacterium]